MTSSSTVSFTRFCRCRSSTSGPSSIGSFRWRTCEGGTTTPACTNNEWITNWIFSHFDIVTSTNVKSLWLAKVVEPTEINLMFWLNKFYSGDGSSCMCFHSISILYLFMVDIEFQLFENGVVTEYKRYTFSATPILKSLQSFAFSEKKDWGCRQKQLNRFIVLFRCSKMTSENISFSKRDSIGRKMQPHFGSILECFEDRLSHEIGWMRIQMGTVPNASLTVFSACTGEAISGNLFNSAD